MMTASLRYLLIIFLLFGSNLLVNSLVGASGGDNDECEDAQETSFEDGDEDEMEYTAPEGQIVTGVCIKSGNNMFLDGHSESLEDGDYEDGCYTIEGVGTDTIVVERNFESKTCQGISHLDIYTDDQNNNEEGDGDEENGNEEDEENNGQSEEEGDGAEDEGNQDPTPTPTPAPSESPTPTPTPTPTPNPTTSPTPEPSPSPSLSDSSSSSSSSSSPSSQNSVASETPRPSPQGQVLGVSTLAQTGIFEESVSNSIFVLGVLLIFLGTKRYAQKHR